MDALAAPGVAPIGPTPGEALEPEGGETSPGDELARLRARVRELEQASRDDRADLLLSMLSHELRSPLQSLLLNVEACLRRLRQPDGTLPEGWLPEKLLRQRQMAGRLELLIDTFLDVGQIAAGQLRFEPEEVDLAELTGDVIRRVGDDLAWARCPCTMDLRPGVIGRWDRLQLDLVVANLLSNAIKYGAGAPVEVAVWGTGETGHLRVTDHGPGIPRADQERIFDKFVRLPSRSHTGGFGLGLWIVRHIVHAAGGTIEVKSEPGRGASFTVSLPRRGPPAGS
jgi:signal transduction histidine kinase